MTQLQYDFTNTANSFA